MSPNKSSGVLAWLACLARLVRSWWAVDRIRVSPREGRLAQLACGTLLRIGGQWYEIESRTVTAGPGSVQLLYECATPASRARLCVSAQESMPATVEFCRDTEEAITLDAAVIEVFARRPGC